MTPPRALPFLALFLSFACRSGPPSPSAFLVVDSPGGRLDLGAARVEASGVRSVALSSGKLVIERAADAAGGVVIRADGACPLTVPSKELSAGATMRRTLEPWFDFGEPGAELGFGKELVIDARPGCAEAARSRVTWKQTAGAPLDGLRLERDGRRLVATMPRLEGALGDSLSWGIVPISPRTRGEVELVAEWSGEGGRVAGRTLRASAAARSRGLPNVATNTRLYLGGHGFHVVTAPEGSHAAIERADGVASFTPDETGHFALADAHGKILRLYAGRYEETPLDCGRSDCHAAIATSARSSPMATILQRGLDGPFAGDYPACAFGCHAVGERGLDDGGFVAVLARFGLGSPDLRRMGFHDLPPALRRLGGVGCVACHGPGTIAEEGGRHAVLRAGVCATCHDAPPRYGHVVAWQSSRMARADADPRTRSDAGCARCHTTWGFLGAAGRKPPEDAPPAGIACAACHAVHPVKPGASGIVGATCAAALAREAPPPALFEGALAKGAHKSDVCLACHAPAPGDGAPSASAAAIWAGRGGIDPATGAPLNGGSLHGSVIDGCVGCHRSGPPGLGRGAGHAFAARAEDCTGCHAARSDPSIRERAVLLWARAAGAPTPSPPHAVRATIDATTPRGRAAWNVALVLEDPAADRHNAPYARALLDAAERFLDAARTKGGAPR
jgi:hypothetical protein